MHTPNRPTTTARHAALIACIRAEEEECGCPADQLATDDRATHVEGDVFAIADNPGRVFHLRVLTIDEASDADIAANATFAHGGECWVIIEA